MKLLFLDHRIPQILENKGQMAGGASTRVFQLVQELSRQGHQTGILTWQGAQSRVSKDPGFDIVESFHSRDSSPNRKIKIKGVDFFYDRYLMYKGVKAYRPDFLFQICSGLNTGVLAFIGKRLDIPFVFLAASNPDADGGYAEILDKRSRQSYEYGLKHAKLIICQNQYQYQHFKKRFANKALHLMPNPFHHQPLPALVPAAERSYVAWLGSFSPVKNLPALLTVAQAVPEINFKIAGSLTTTSTEEIKECLNQLDNLQNVELVGPLTRDQVFPFLAKASVLLNTSILEGFSNTFLEAFAVGTPIVTRDCIDPDEVIEKHQLGLTVANYEDLPQALISLINDPNYQQLTIRCREYVEKHHNVTNICTSLVEALEKHKNQ